MAEEKGVQLLCEAIIPDGPMKNVEEIEESIRTTYRKTIWTKFIKAINDFNLIEFKAVSLNPGFRQYDLDNFKKNLEKLNIDCEIIDTNIWEIANEKAKDYPCFLCAKMRRGILYKKVEEFGYNKLTLGHHFDDVIETTMINMLYAGTLKTMTPKVSSTSGNLSLIRPLVYVKEEDIIKYTKRNGILAMNCGCTIEAGKTSSKRREVKNLLADLEEKHPGVKQSIFNAMKNINLDYVFGYTRGNKKALNEVDLEND